MRNKNSISQGRIQEQRIYFDAARIAQPKKIRKKSEKTSAVSTTSNVDSLCFSGDNQAFEDFESVTKKEGKIFARGV